MRATSALAVLLALATTPHPARPAVVVVPVFWKGQTVPGFVVRCNNVSGEIQTVMNHMRGGPAFRLDGEPYGEVGPDQGIALAGPLSLQVIPAGGRYVELVLLGDTHRSAHPAGLFETYGELASRSYILSLATGEHSIAFRCWDQWSDELRFTWALSREQRAAERDDAPVEGLELKDAPRRP
jgi:hypothetical protein